MFRLKNVAIAILISLFVPLGALAQIVIINGEVGKRNLEWRDFTGAPDDASPFHSYTYWNVRYRFTGAAFKEDTAIIKGLLVELRLDSVKTWIKKGKETPKLLVHEQGHFDIGHLLMLDFLKAVKETTFYRSDFGEKMRNLFNEYLSKYKEMGEKYDEETRHHNNERKQKEWNQFIKTELVRLSNNKGVT